MFLRMV